MAEKKKIETIAELVAEQNLLRKQLDVYVNRCVRLRELEPIEAKVAELEARIKKLEKT